MISCNFTKGRSGKTVQEITIHHTASKITLDGLHSFFNNKRNKVSAHYGVCDEDYMQFVSENDTAWTNGNWDANCRAITIEVSNNKTFPRYEISDKSFETLINLVYQIAKRHNLLPLVKGKSLTWHRMYTKTQCPSDFLLAKIDTLIKEVNFLAEKDKKDEGIFRVRESWDKPKTQAGAFKNFDNAVNLCNKLNDNTRFRVYDSSGNCVYP